MRRQKSAAAHDEIAEIELAGCLKGRVIGGIDCGNLLRLLFGDPLVVVCLRHPVGQRAKAVRRDQLVLGARDHLQNVAQRLGRLVKRQIMVERQARQHRLEQAKLIVEIDDLRMGGETQAVAELAQQIEAEGVEGSSPDLRRGFARNVSDPFAQLLGRLVGIGQDEDLVRIGAAFDQLFHARDQRPGFAGAGPGLKQQGAGGDMGSQRLRRVEWRGHMRRRRRSRHGL